MKNKIKSLLLAVILVSGICWIAQAFNEPGLPDGGFGLSQTGAVKITTGTGSGSQLYETRRVKVSNDGQLYTLFGVSQSTYLTVASSTDTDIMNAVVYGSNTLCTTCSASSQTLTNPNVFAVGSSSEPIFLKGFMVGDAPAVRLRIWDSRGSTDPTSSSALPLYDRTVSTGTSEPSFNHWLSSGIVAMVGTSTPANAFRILLQWAVTKKQ